MITLNMSTEKKSGNKVGYMSRGGDVAVLVHDTAARETTVRLNGEVVLTVAHKQMNPRYWLKPDVKYVARKLGWSVALYK